ncbi:MAG: hypothetical protein CM1200mP41_00650 [Gammaproteobacteria bacterium]|nr:MAG: hypothetical protein CM1200mP41_00650 [Gammaproteobacteria bacterium]
MQTEYDPHQIEKEVQDYWSEQHSFEVTEDPHGKNFIAFNVALPVGQSTHGTCRNYTIGE